MNIYRLPESLASFLKAGPILADATQCALELVYNCLDAGATSVAVRVNCRTFYMQVADNGHGICKEDLDLIGQEHVTSKCSSELDLGSLIPTFGYRGCALAALSRTSSLEIQTRHSSASVTFKKRIGNGIIGPVELNSSIRPTPGTTVTVNDLLGAMPVRRQRIKDVFDLDDILHHLESLAVIHPDVSFSLRNDITGKVLLQTHRQLNCKPTLAQLFGLAENRLLIPFSYSQENISISGHICRELHSDSSLQLVYVNKRIVHKSMVHKCILHLLKKYGKFWDKDRNDSDAIVDLEGYVFIVKICLPYLAFTIDRSGRRLTLNLQNTEGVLRCVHRTVKKCLTDDEVNTSLQSIAWVPEPRVDQGDTIKEFGPSQLRFAVRGRKANRQSNTGEYESRELPLDQAGPSKVHETSPREVHVHSPKNTPMKRKRSVVDQQENVSLEKQSIKDAASSTLSRQFFLKESSNEGTALAENAPIFELEDFSRFPFHDFLAWLQIKSEHDFQANKLLSEWLSLRPRPNVVYTNKPAPLVSLKEVRKEKFGVWTKKMLDRIEKLSAMYQNRNRIIRENHSLPRKLRKTTTTYIEARSVRNESTRDAHLWPQVSFNEFMGWLKLKMKYGETASNIIHEYHKFKSRENSRHWPSLANPTKSQKTESIRICENLPPKRRKQDKMRQFPNYLVKPHPHTTNKCNQADDGGSDVEDSLYTTYRSHYQNQLHTADVAQNAEKQVIPATPNIDSTTLRCNEALLDSELSQESNDYYTTPAADQVITIKQSHQQLQTSPVAIRNVHIQATVTTKDSSVQSFYLNNSIAVQTEPITSDVGIQTSQNHVDCGVSPIIPSIELKLNQRSSEKHIETSLPNDEMFVLREERHTVSLPDTASADSLWEQRRDDSGNTFFVHSVSGSTLFHPPSSSTRLSFNIQNVVGGVVPLPSANNPLPELTADDLTELRAAISESCDGNLADVKWPADHEGQIKKFGNELVNWLHDAPRCRDDLGIPTGEIPKTEAAIHQLLSSFTFSKEDLRNAQVIGQLDKKFIVTLFKKPDSDVPLICLFDQHAVDERITLESLMKKYMASNDFVSENLKVPFMLAATSTAVDVMSDSPHIFIAYGLTFLLEDSQSCLVTAVPSCFVRKQERESVANRLPMLKRMVRDLIDEVVDFTRNTRGSNVKIPKTIFNVIVSEACRSAIKFNQELELDRMADLISKLSECQLPFQCAHGRPSLVPIYELPLDPDPMLKVSKLNLKKLNMS